MRAGIGIQRSGGFGGGLVRAATEVQDSGMDALAKSAQIEQRREQSNQMIEDKNRAGNAQLGSMVGAAGGAALGAKYGTVFGPVGTIIGGIAGGLIAGLF
jgi:phage tail tape-measure protein